MKRKHIVALIAVPAILLTVLNLFQTWQYQHDVFPNGNSLYEYKTMFGKTKRDVLPAKMLNDNGLVERAFVAGSFTLVDSAYTDYPNNALLCKRGDREFAQIVGERFENLKLNPQQRLRYVSVARYASRDPIGGSGARMCVSFERGDQILFQMYKRIDGDAYNRFDTIVLETQAPRDLQPTDVCKMFIWNSFDSPLLIQSQRVDVLTIAR